MNEYQVIHNLKQEVKRLKAKLAEERNDHKKQLDKLREEILSPKLSVRNQKDKWEHAMRSVCLAYSMTPDEIHEQCRIKEKLYARHLFCFACKTELGMKVSEISLVIERDRSTVENAITKATDLIKYDKQVSLKYDKIKRTMSSFLVN
jgi:chromosomal replication initiation ATPase DnaA